MVLNMWTYSVLIIRRLFSCFEPRCGILTLNLNWLSIIVVVLIPTGYYYTKSRLRAIYNKAFSTLRKELLTTNRRLLGRSTALTFSATFLFILLNNFFGLLPYVFTSTSHICVTLTIRRLVWVSLILPSIVNTPSLFLAHLVPKGTPMALVPFIVLIELIRNIIRPFTLGIRLAANMVAGHLLLVLTSSPAYSLRASVLAGVLVGLLTLTVLELAVSIIQRYVFIRLGSLYIREVRNPALN